MKRDIQIFENPTFGKIQTVPILFRLIKEMGYMVVFPERDRSEGGENG